MIPRRFIRTIPADPPLEAEVFWEGFQTLHPDWEFVTYQDPINPSFFPVTSAMWDHCASGAQRAGLIRLEALLEGGIYVDSDVKALRPFDPLVGLEGFAGWEDKAVVPDAVLGAREGHPAVEECLHLALARIAAGAGPWESGPGVTTTVLPGRSDWLLLPPGTLYPVHYREKHLLASAVAENQPWALCVHHWAGSWLTPAQRERIDRSQTRRPQRRA